MKKTLRMIGMMLCAILMVAGLNACSNDDDDEKNPSIVGTWETVAGGKTTQLTFKPDRTCFWKEWQTGQPGDFDTDSGRYDTTEDVLSIWWDSEADEPEPWTCTFVITGNKMTTSENGGTTWTRKS